jgi:hypothetical protein
MNTLPYVNGPQILQKSKSHLKIQGTTRVTYRKFRNKDPEILRRQGAKFSRPGDVAPGICAAGR